MRRVLTWWRGQPWLGPEVLAAGVIFTLICAAAITRDFALFFFELMALPFLLVTTLACMGWSAAHRRGGRSIPLAVALVIGAWPLSFQVQSAWDWTAVTLWSLSHRDAVAAAAAGRDAVLTGWGDWGWAGGSTFAYVVADAQDASGSAAGAERWRRRLRLDCPVAHARRIRAHLYLIETSDCPFDGILFPS